MYREDVFWVEEELDRSGKWEFDKYNRGESDEEEYEYKLDDVDVEELKESEFRAVIEWSDNRWGTRGGRIKRYKL